MRCVTVAHSRRQVTRLASPPENNQIRTLLATWYSRLYYIPSSFLAASAFVYCHWAASCRYLIIKKIRRSGMSPFSVQLFLLALVQLNFATGSTRNDCSGASKCDGVEMTAKKGALATSSYANVNIDGNEAVNKKPQERFRISGNTAQSRPCCTSWGPGRVDCFIRAPESNVMHISIDNGVYSEWEDLGGTIIDEIECVSRDVGIIDVLVLGTSSALFIKTFSGGKWSGWQSKGGRLIEVPSCITRTPSAVDCMFRGQGNEGQHIGAVDGKWTEYKNLGGILFCPFGCTSLNKDHLACFGANGGMTLVDIYWTTGTGWSRYYFRGGLMNGRPSATSWSSNRMDIFSLGVKENSVMQRTYDGKWRDWVDLGGVFHSAPECVTTGVGKIHCFAVGEGSYLYRNSFDGMKWLGWEKSFGFFLETPSCVVSDEDEVTCAIRRYNKEVALLTYRF